MSEKTRAVLSVVVILACFALLGYLVTIKAEGSHVAALSIVGIVVAWVTRPPERKNGSGGSNPPSGPGASMLVPIGAVVALASILACGCSASQKQAEADALYVSEHMRCVDKYETKLEIDACREAVRIRWNAARDAGGDQ